MILIKMDFKNYITTKNIIFAVVALLFIKFAFMISGIVMMFFAAYVLACSLNPLVEILSKKMKRSTAASLVIIMMITIFIAFFMPVIIIASKQINSFLQILPDQIATVKNILLNREFLGQKIIDLLDLPSFIPPMSAFTTNLVNQSINMTISFASAILYGFTMCIVMYYFMVDKKQIRKLFLSLFPKPMKRTADKVAESISHKIGGYIIALGVTMLSVGIIFTIGLVLLRVDYAILLGLIATILDIIPVIGPTIALIICLLMCYQLGPLMLFLIVLIFFFAQWIENNFVRPYVFGKFLDIHPILVFFAIFVTAKFFGLLGVVFAPAIAATACVILEELYIKPINNEKKNV